MSTKVKFRTLFNIKNLINYFLNINLKPMCINKKVISSILLIVLFISSTLQAQIDHKCGMTGTGPASTTPLKPTKTPATF